VPDGLALERAGLPPRTRLQVRGLHWLEKVWAAFTEAAAEMARTLGVPLCVEGCGLCCTTNTPSAWGVEVVRAASWLWEQTPQVRTTILDRIETWLTTPVLEVEPPVRTPLRLDQPGMGGPRPGLEVRGLEILACARGRCPLLGPDLQCAVYPVRPLGCRAWGVTHMADYFCKRPVGRGESSEYRAFYGGEGTARLRAYLRILHERIKGDAELARSTFFPTALYAQFRASRLIELLPRIPTARLVGGLGVLEPQLFTEKLESAVVLPPVEVSA
jgi:Fe-S-cluster containining protein